MRSQYRKLRNAIVTLATFHPQQPSCAASGFLFAHDEELYVVTAAHDVLFTTVTDPNHPIFVGVYNVNGSGRNETYLTSIVGVDATADVGLLRLRPRRNQPVPWAKTHPHIRLEANPTCAGDRVLNISSPLNLDLASYVQGTVRTPEWFDPTGKFIVGCLLTDLLVYGASSGSPVLSAATGRCVGLVTFGFVGTAGTAAPGFTGGCAARTLRRILRDLLTGCNTNCVPGQTYLTNLKGYLAASWFGVNAFSITNLFPQNYAKLQSRGFVLTSLSPDSPLVHLRHGAPPLKVGDIVVWAQRPGHERITFGEAQGQQPVGNFLWFINPEERPLARFGVIRDPWTNSCITEVETRLNITYDPNTETPPTFGLPNDTCAVETPLVVFDAHADLPPGTTIQQGVPLAVGVGGDFRVGPFTVTPPVKTYDFFDHDHFLRTTDNNSITITALHLFPQEGVRIDISLASGETNEAVTMQSFTDTFLGTITFPIPDVLQPFPILPNASTAYVLIRVIGFGLVTISSVRIKVQFAPPPAPP